jgi:hypothetical protein
MIDKAQPAPKRCCRGRLPRRSIVRLPAVASRLLPAVASHAIGFAEPDTPLARFRRLLRKAEQAGTGQNLWAAATEANISRAVGEGAMPGSFPDNGHAPALQDCTVSAEQPDGKVEGNSRPVHRCCLPRGSAAG